LFLKHQPWNVHVSGVFFWTIVFRFKPTKKSLISLNWQVLKVLILKFQASTLDQCHHLLINLSCKALVNYSMPQIALEQEIIAATIAIALIFYTLLMYTNTARSTEEEQRRCSEALTSEGALQNFRAYKKWIPRVFQRVWKMFGFFVFRNIFWLCSTYSVQPL